MSVKQLKGGKWRVEVDRKGIPRTRKTFSVKSEAELFEREYLAKYQGQHRQHTDQRTLLELIEHWFIYHGINLSDGERRKRLLVQMAGQLKNPVASKLTPEQFVQWRYRLTSDDKGGLTHKTANNMHGYLSAMYNKLRKLKVIDYENPISGVEFIKIQERQLSYLSESQIKTLLESIESNCQNESTWFVTQICLRTGARWSEGEMLSKKQLHNGMITFEFTKSKKTRSVPLSHDFYIKLLDYSKFKNPDDRIFTNCIGSFRRAVYRTELNFPRGQMTHILRHTFASHFIMNGGNILTLQKILGHSDIQMTMKYAHLAPDHFKDAISLNPLSKWR